jgi:hypothetical protein
MIKDCFGSVTCEPCDRSQVFTSSMRWPRELLQAGLHRRVRLLAALLSGYVCLIEEKSLAANQRPLILPNGVLSGLSAAALRYFADTRLLKDALDMMTEETTWLETNTAQAKTHFSYNHVAGQSPTRRIGQGDHVQLSKDSAKKGVVVKNNGSSQPYDVSWENGQHSRE